MQKSEKIMIKQNNIKHTEIKSIVKDTFLYSKEIFTFSYKRIIYRIPYNDINYIEKESNIKRCIIHTIKDNYYISLPITKLEKLLKDMFIKTHQSCIININNIKEITKNEVKFYNDDKTNLINKDMKNKLLELFYSFNI